MKSMLLIFDTDARANEFARAPAVMLYQHMGWRNMVVTPDIGWPSKRMKFDLIVLVDSIRGTDGLGVFLKKRGSIMRLP